VINLPKVGIAPHWHCSFLAEMDANDRASATCYRGLEDIGIVPMIVAELSDPGEGDAQGARWKPVQSKSLSEEDQVLYGAM
jgi:hypothetical protein